MSAQARVRTKGGQQRARPARKPGRLETAARRKASAAAKAVLPHAALLGTSAAAGMALHEAGLPWLGLGAAGTLAARQGFEHLHWHRQGGKAAMRHRARYQGTARRREISRALSASAARQRAAVTRPSLPRHAAITEAAVHIGGHGKRGRALYGSLEDCYAFFGIARSGKTGAMSRVLSTFPGAALSTSTRTDVWAHTIHARRELAAARGGHAWVLNPGGDGLIASDFACSPLAGCGYFPRAAESAGYLVAASPKDPGGADAWIDDRGAQLLRVVMHAAAVGGGDMMTVLDWVRSPGNADLLSVLGSQDADPEALRSLLALTGADKGTHLQAVIVTAESALSWLSDPVMRRAACPPPGGGIDVWDFLETCSTAYLIGDDKPHNALTRYFAWFAGHLHDAAKRHASMQPGGRLDPPLGLVIDEPALTCPVPLDRWCSEDGGHGITLITGFQSFAQLPQRWGENGGRVILDNSVAVILGGYKAGPELERISAACGERDTWHHVRNPDGSRTRQPATERLFPPERIRALHGISPGRDPQALLLYRTVRPVVITVPPVWRLRGYRRAATGLDSLTALPQPQQAIEPARREAISATVISTTVNGDTDD